MPQSHEGTMFIIYFISKALKLNALCLCALVAIKTLFGTNSILNYQEK
jgi:hypothetical protein